MQNTKRVFYRILRENLYERIGTKPVRLANRTGYLHELPKLLFKLHLSDISYEKRWQNTYTPTTP